MLGFSSIGIKPIPIIKQTLVAEDPPLLAFTQPIALLAWIIHRKFRFAVAPETTPRRVRRE